MTQTFTHKTGRTFQFTMDESGTVTGHENGCLVEEFKYDRDGNKITAGFYCYGAPSFVAALIEVERYIERERETFAKYPFYAPIECPSLH